MVVLRTVLILCLLSSTLWADGQLLCFGAKWCQPCREMKPVIEQLVRDGFPIHRIDIDERRDVAERYGIQTVPVFLLVDDQGKPIDRINEATTLGNLRAMLAHYRVGRQPATMRGQTPDAHPSQNTTPGVGTQPATNPATNVPSGPVPFGNAAQNSATNTPHNAARINAMQSTVRLKVDDADGYSFGTGTVIDLHGDEALVLTCGHLFRESEGKGTILLDRFDGKGNATPVTGSLISFDMDRDIALVSMKVSQPIRVAKLGRLGRSSQPGDPIFSIGCSRGAAPTIIEGKVNQVDRYLGPPNITASGRPVDGRSGGGLFNANGELIGVCSAADPEFDEGLYGALPRVYYELDRNGLSFVYADDDSNTIAATAHVAPAVTPNTLAPNNLTPAIPPNFAVTPPAGNAAMAPPQSQVVPAAASIAADSLNANPMTAGKELVCVVKGEPGQQNRVIVIRNPSTALLRVLEEEAARGER